jgi:hypothetical protein
MKRRLARMISAIATTLLVFGCSTPRWQTQQHQMSWGEHSENLGYIDILTDQKTGKTWILRTGRDNKFYWQPTNTGEPPL